MLANTNFVQQASGISNRRTNNNRDQASDVTGNQQKSSILSQVKITSSTMLQNKTETSGIQKETNDIINTTWRNSTQKKYKYVFKRWEEHCSKKGIGEARANTNNKLNFLTRECNRGLSYKALQNVISALSNRISSHN